MSRYCRILLLVVLLGCSAFTFTGCGGGGSNSGSTSGSSSSSGSFSSSGGGLSPGTSYTGADEASGSGIPVSTITVTVNPDGQSCTITRKTVDGVTDTFQGYISPPNYWGGTSSNGLQFSGGGGSDPNSLAGPFTVIDTEDNTVVGGGTLLGG